jgi:RimJ/RimL family protein N-acetyltransferase
MSPFNFRVPLAGELVRLRPLEENDFEALFAVASDPAIWEQHPEPDRYERKVFEGFFRGAIESKGAFLITDARSGEVIGTSRYLGFNPEKHSVEVGYTFLARRCWGNTYNRELKKLMCDYAFRFVDSVEFRIGAFNRRSRAAVEKLGAELEAEYAAKRANGREHPAVLYRLRKVRWHAP